MKKINLSRRSKLFIGGIGSLAVLATIPATVVACSSTTETSNQEDTQLIGQVYSQIKPTYTSTNTTITQINPTAVNFKQYFYSIRSSSSITYITKF